MESTESKKPVYDLEERTFQFAKAVRLMIKTLPKTIANIEDIKQLVKSSGSAGANYIEANESLSKKDFLVRVKISRKEIKESSYWLRLIDETNQLENDQEVKRLLREAVELKKIFSAIIEKSK
ncbi:MAG: four helix bundle protein [Bacteroidales bacterium]|nr:four helix bundle protein [Bacteroidales bacterium]